MKELLLIGYHFPPMASIGALRPYRFAKYLSDFGWHVTVLSVGNDWRYKSDPSFNASDFHGCRVVRASRPPIQKIIRRVMRRFFVKNLYWYSFLDEFYDWYPSAVSKGRDLLNEKRFDAILATAPPYTDLRIARTLAREYQLPVIADLRDPFTQNDFITFPTCMHKMFYTAYENNLLSGFDRIIVAWESIAEINMKVFGIPQTKFHIITNGFEPDIFDWLHEMKPSNDEFTIGYFGSIYGIRSARYLFQAVAELFREHPELRYKTNILFAGYLDEESLRKLANKYKCQDRLKILGLLPRSQALQMMASCSALVLFTGMVSKALPGKIFDYIAAGRPILSFSKQGPLTDFIADHQIGISVDGDSPVESANILKEWIEAHLNGRPFFKLNDDKIKEFDGRLLAKKLAGILDSIV